MFLNVLFWIFIIAAALPWIEVHFHIVELLMASANDEEGDVLQFFWNLISADLVLVVVCLVNAGIVKFFMR